MEKKIWKIPIGMLQGDSDFPLGAFFLCLCQFSFFIIANKY
ncbi:MAG: hypothetical protein H6Q43_884 [Deltaproteobacteria bacterium]|nr:hypothetical protein [Deltaproteobacteria bacterium]MBP1717446.1 hypothetical protein [Deltaproteobacteria bacterium]